MAIKRDQDELSPALRFLLTSKCNFRCGFCHNEFQGDMQRGPEPVFDPELVDQLMLAAERRYGTVRVKFSGGEPMLRWGDLTQLLAASQPARCSYRALFTNMSVGSHERLDTLKSLKLDKIHVNLPTFNASQFQLITEQGHTPLSEIMELGSYADDIGIAVQFNMVITGDLSQPTGRRKVMTELSNVGRIAPGSTLALIADDRSNSPLLSTSLISSIIKEHGGTLTQESTTRSTEYELEGRSVVVTHCSQWESEDPSDIRDLYIVPPGRVLDEHLHGRAYEEKRG